MAMHILYFLIAIFSTTIGAITGIGGGVIIKPVLDILANYNTETISLLSSITVFAMAIVSVIKQLLNKSKIDINIIIPLAIGSIIGGSIGHVMLEFIIKNIELKEHIIILQNILLALLIIITLFYTINKAKIKTKNMKGIISSIIVGIFLGIISSFLGIGGGPINVTVFMYFFSYNTKMSVLSSIVTILFSQVSKLISVLFNTGFEAYDLSVAPFMIVGAIMGGFIGSKLSIKLTDKQVGYAFYGVQILVFLICIGNIILQL